VWFFRLREAALKRLKVEFDSYNVLTDPRYARDKGEQLAHTHRYMWTVNH
jgi:hypothetical protein